MEWTFDLLRVVISLAFLFYASWSDWKSREISNKVWILMAPIGLALTLTQFVVFNPQQLPWYGVSFAITAALSVALFYVGAFGGADAKALICLALTLPLYPNKLLQLDVARVSPVFPLTIFSNSVFFAAFTAVYTVVRNFSWKFKTGKKLFEGLENQSAGRKLLTFLTGYKINAADLQKGHMLPIEDIALNETGTDERRLLVLSKDEEREKIVERILNAKQQGKLQNEVWATPGLPLIIFITFGLIVSLALGDLIWILLGLILKQGV